jgi:nucleotide-binding universal stress UspA family protein
MYQKILVPLDGSARAEKILPHVEEMARRYQAKIILLKVDEPPMMLERDEVIDAAAYTAERRGQKDATDAYLALIREKLLGRGLQVGLRVGYGSIVKAILDTAAEEDADLVAMASHGLTALPRQFYGSTTAAVLQRIDRPLLLIRSVE